MYKTVIGLEVHCEVITNSKNFSTAKNSYSEYPNENIDTTDINELLLYIIDKGKMQKSNVEHTR